MEVQLMKSIAYTTLLFLFAVFLFHTAYAAEEYPSPQPTDLPIDINAIGQQNNIQHHFAVRFGTDLFTADSARINEAQALQIRNRQESVNYIFAAAPQEYYTPPQTQILNRANEMELFAAHVHVGSMLLPPQTEPMATWIIVLILAACAGAGFIFALILRARKRRRQAEDVY